MQIKELFDLYLKERDYETKVFGSYGDIKSLNFASFILFCEEYVSKMKKAYVGKWDDELPPWLLTCRELEEGSDAPTKAYENLIKLFALAGAALETFVVIDPDEWRDNIEEDMKKWAVKNIGKEYE